MTDSTISQKLSALSKFKFKLSQKDKDYIAPKGFEIIKEHAFQIVNSRIASDYPKNDGKQTPMRGHPVFIAQHATATCCRGCISKWHGIEKGSGLTQRQMVDELNNAGVRTARGCEFKLVTIQRLLKRLDLSTAAQ